MRIVLEDHDPNWPEAYAAEARRIQRTLGPAAMRVEHVGSTSVAGLRAKPVIDIVVYRGGDMATAWFHTFLKDVLAFGLTGVAVVAAAIAAVWAISGIYLGRQYKETKE